MGCESSKTAHENLSQRRNTLVVKPKAAIQVDDGVKLADEKGTILIFIFGGPGSGKGTIVNNLVDMFNFRFICGEELIMESLIQKMLPGGGSGTGTSATRELSKRVAADSSELTLHWVLGLLDTEISKYPGEVIIVDMVPNLKFLLRIPELSKECSKEMVAFEEKHPIAFAIDLALDSAHLLQNINQTHACTKAPKQAPNGEALKSSSSVKSLSDKSSSDKSLSDKSSSDKSSSDKSSSDEMDISRTERRFNIYKDSVKEFLAYFKRKNNLLTVDTSCGDVTSVWDSVCNYVVDSEISKPTGIIEQVVLFKFHPDDFSEIDRDRYPVKDVLMSDLDVSEEASPVEILKALRNILQEDATQFKTFMLDIAGTSLASPDAMEKTAENRLIFYDNHYGQLDYFIHGIKRHTDRKKSLARKKAQTFNTLTTSNNEALIFPAKTDMSLCRQICVTFKQALNC